MEITEVRVKLMEDSDDRLQAFCSITFDDCFVVRDLKIIEGSNGPFVAMPSRKLTSHCPQCGCKNHLRSAYCNQCGARLKDDRTTRDQEGRTKLYADIAHPINSECREKIQNRVIAEFRSELENSKEPGYMSRYDDDYELDAGSEELPEDESRAGEPSSDESDGAVQETTHIEPGETQPPPPHKAPSRQRANRPSRSPRDGEFGAGIF
jgi:stage V sporulation protein G